jgi:hypothetical protein
MTDREKTLTEIREALEKATPGPWYMSKLAKGYLMANCGCSTKDIATFIEYNEDGSVHVEFDNWGNNAHLIANAPEWLGFLLDELDKRDECTKENPCRECLKMSVDGYKEIVRELEDENRKLRKERDKLIEVLRHYADRRNHPPFWLYDDGQRARDILKEIGVTVE